MPKEYESSAATRLAAAVAQTTPSTGSNILRRRRKVNHPFTAALTRLTVAATPPKGSRRLARPAGRGADEKNQRGNERS